MTADTWHHALWYIVEHGLSVLPLRAREKVPAVANGVHAATRHLEQVAVWERALPTANLGIACGGLMRLVVLDFDTPDAVERLTAQYGERPATWTATTPRGGRHEYYVMPAGVERRNTCAKLAPHVDTRASGGYVVAPPSLLSNGRGYAWCDGLAPSDLERAPVPAPILAALLPAPSRALPLPCRPTTVEPERRVGRYLAQLPPLADGMGRNITAFRIAAFVLHDVHGAEADALVALAVWNARNLEPLEDAALRRAVENALRYGGHRRVA